MKAKKFALFGAAGYIAPRHMQAIKDTNNDLVAIMDPSDSVGIVDSYAPHARYFRDLEGITDYIQDLQSTSEKVDYVSVCSPNYLHEAHARTSMIYGCDAICEKPLVVDLAALDRLEHAQIKTGKTVRCILQLRHHAAVKDLRAKVEKSQRLIDVELQYVTSRGSWYLDSWKGDENKSGGIALNIGVHFFDMLAWILGEPETTKVFCREPSKIRGETQFRKGAVRWFLSLDERDLPAGVQERGGRTFRNIKFDDHELEFSTGFTDLHTKSYADILAGGGFGIEDARRSIELVEKIRSTRLASS